MFPTGEDSLTCHMPRTNFWPKSEKDLIKSYTLAKLDAIVFELRICVLYLTSLILELLAGAQPTKREVAWNPCELADDPCELRGQGYQTARFAGQWTFTPVGTWFTSERCLRVAGCFNRSCFVPLAPSASFSLFLCLFYSLALLLGLHSHLASCPDRSNIS